MKKIAVVYLGRKGGGPVYAYEMTKGLIENGHAITAFISSGVENMDSWLKLDACTLEIIPTYSSIPTYVKNTISFRFGLYQKLRKKYKKCDFDACYIPMGHPWDDYIVNLIGNPQKIFTLHDPIIHSTNHSLLSKVSDLGQSLLNVGIHKQKPDDIVILSESFREYTSREYCIAPEHVHVIPHGIFDFYQAVDRGDIFHYDPQKTNFLFFGRIDAYKGLDVLAEAYALLKKRQTNITLTIVGSGDFSRYAPLYAHLPDVQIVNRWIEDSEVASFFRSDAKLILVLPYKDATQSGVIPTAMCFEIPVIASNTGGLAEQIKDGISGYLCTPNDPVSLAECMEKVALSDTATVTRNAREYVNSLDWNTLSKTLAAIIS